MLELGAGGGHGDLNQQHELEVGDPAVVGDLMSLCSCKLHDQKQTLSAILRMLAEVISEGKQSLSLQDFVLKEAKELPKRDVDGKWKVSYEVIGHPPNVAVPTHFYKVIFAEDGKTGGNVSLGAFVLPNDRIANDKPLQDFEVPIEAVERASGLEFAGLLPPARRKRLCKEVSCSIIVKTYEQRQRQMLSPPPVKGTTPPSTMTGR